MINRPYDLVETFSVWQGSLDGFYRESSSTALQRRKTRQSRGGRLPDQAGYRCKRRETCEPTLSEGSKL